VLLSSTLVVAAVVVLLLLLLLLGSKNIKLKNKSKTLQSSWKSITSNREQHLASWKLKTYKKLVELKKLSSGSKAEKKAAKETQISSTKPWLHFLLAICYIFFADKKTHTKLKLSQAQASSY
jgi:hypothetical protein